MVIAALPVELPSVSQIPPYVCTMAYMVRDRVLVGLARLRVYEMTEPSPTTGACSVNKPLDSSSKRADPVLLVCAYSSTRVHQPLVGTSAQSCAVSSMICTIASGSVFA